MTDPREIRELSDTLPGFTSWGPRREDGTRSGLNCCFMRSGGKDDGSGLPLATYEELKDLLWRVPPETLLSILPQPLLDRLSRLEHAARQQLDVWTFAAMLWIAREASYDWSTPRFIEELHAMLDKQSAALATGGGRDG